MKRIIAIVLFIVMAFTLCSCGNMSLGLGNFTFTHIHFTDYTSGHCAAIEKWYDNETGIEVKTKEFGSMYLSEGSYIMFIDDTTCPYCGE